MNNPLVLTIDLGTQSVRTALVDKKGNIVSIIKKPYEPAYYSKKTGYAEQDPDFYWNYILDCLKKLTSKNKDNLDRIIGGTITTFRDSSVQLDENNRPIRDCILWLDQRMAKAKEKLPLLHRILFSLVGMKNTIILNRQRTVAHWLKENEKSTWSKTRKYVNISGYLTYKLTGNLVDSVSCITGHYPINFKKRQWHKPGALKGRIFGIPQHMLCELRQPGEVLGILQDSVADEVGLPRGIKFIASGSDKACETVGLGSLSRHSAAVSYGTACTVEVTNPRYHEPEKFLPAYPAAIPNFYNMEVQVYRGYWMLNWFTKEFAHEFNDASKIQRKNIQEIFNSKLLDIPPGSEGLVLQPYWGPGLSRPLAKGCIVGFSDVHTREHLYRAIVEGIAYALREGLESIVHSQKRSVRYLKISGGGSQSDSICQITSDIFGLPVSRVQTFETTTLGAAIATFLALGEFNDIQEAVKSMVRTTTTFSPNEVAHQQYNYLYKNVYTKLYPSLKDVYKDLKKFGKK